MPQDAEGFLATLPIEKFYGVGKKSVEKLHALHIFTGKDLQQVPEMTLIDLFGRFGFDLYRKARGISNSPVKTTAFVNLLAVRGPMEIAFIMMKILNWNYQRLPDE